MNFTRLLCAVAAALLLFVAAAPDCRAADLRITEMAVTTKVVKGKPIDSVWRISSSSVDALYCFTRIAAPAGTDTTIKHIWYLNGEPKLEDVMPVKGSRWRAYSQIRVNKGLSGQWRCDVQDSEGNVLKSVSFTMN